MVRAGLQPGPGGQPGRDPEDEPGDRACEAATRGHQAMSSMPTVASPSTMVSGFSGLLAAADCRLTTVGPIEAAVPGTSNSTVTCVGAATWPGATSANSSSRLCGFAAMPVTRR